MLGLPAAEFVPGFSATPSLSYSTYFGGSGSDIVTSVAVDGIGTLYLAGYTNSIDLPKADVVHGSLGPGSCGGGENTYPCFDAFVAKVDPTGQRLLYIAFLGGSGDDFATSVAVDSGGSAYIAGYTNSLDLPAASAFQTDHAGASCGAGGGAPSCFDSFVAKLNPAGTSWIYATYLGGSGDDLAQAIAVDEAGNAIITGTTTSEDFPTRQALQPEWRGGATESFVAKFDAAGSRLAFASLLGGSGDDFSTSLALDGAGGIYLAGTTNSPDLAASPGPQPGYAGGTCGALASTFPCFDAFVAKVAPDGAALDYLTYLGGTGGDYAYGIAVDLLGRATVAGSTTSQDFPVTFGAFQITGGGNDVEAFVTRLDPAGHTLVYSTYLGGGGPDSAAGVAVDPDGRTVIVGTTWGSDFPAVNSAQASPGGFYDAFLAVMNEAGTALEFSTRLGGAGHEKCHGVALDRFANAYMVAETFSTDYPSVRALQPLYGGGGFDGVVTKVALGPTAVLDSSSSRIDFEPQLVGTRSDPQSVLLTNIGGGELVVESVEASGEFKASSDCATLAPGATCDLSLVFAPTLEGSRAGSVTIEHNGLGGVLQLDLSGVGTAPEIRLSAGNIAFDSQLVGTESGPRVIMLSNPGTAPLVLSRINVTGDFGQSNDCPLSIPVGGSCSIRIVFSPTTSGDHEGALSVTNHLPEETRQALLTGRGSDFSLASSPAKIAIAAGESATFTVAAIPLGGLRETVAFACTGVPRAASCSLSQLQISLDGSTPSEVKATVSTTSRGTAAPHYPEPAWPVLLAALVLVLLPATAIKCILNRPPSFRWSLGYSFMMALALLVSACGGGGGSSQPPIVSQGTPAGSYVLTVTATCGSVSRGSSISLIVR